MLIKDRASCERCMKLLLSHDDVEKKRCMKLGCGSYVTPTTPKYHAVYSSHFIWPRRKKNSAQVRGDQSNPSFLKNSVTYPFVFIYMINTN